MRKLLVLICALASFATVSAQDAIYSILSRDPDNYRPTVFYLVPLDVNSTLDHLTLASSARLETVLKHRLMLWGSGYYSWAGSTLVNKHYDSPEAVNGLQNDFGGEVGGAFFFLSRVYNSRVKVTLAESYRFVYFTRVPSDVRRMLGVRGGVQMNQRAFAVDESDNQYYKYHSIGSSTTEYTATPGGPYIAGQPAGDFGYPFSMAHTQSVFAGIHLRTIKNTHINVAAASGKTKVAKRAFGHRSNSLVTDVFADVLLPYGLEVERVLDVTNKTWDLVPNDDIKNPIGWRAGLGVHNARGSLFHCTAMVGQRPGLRYSNDLLKYGFFINFNIGVNIGVGRYKTPDWDTVE